MASSERGFFEGDGALPCFGEEPGVLLAGEGGGDGFGEAEREEAGADGVGRRGLGVGGDGEGRGEGVGEAVVAVHAGYFFDEIDLSFEVEAPGWEVDFKGGVFVWKGV